MKTRDERMDEWMREEFRKTQGTAEQYPVFAELFGAVFNRLLNEDKIDALEYPDQLLDADEPDFGTARKHVETRSPEFFEHYVKCIKEGHSAEFARIFALKVQENCDDVKSASCDAFEAIRIGFDCALSNPAYAEAHAFCLRQGQSPLYSEKCAGYLIDCLVFDFPLAQKKATDYEKAFNQRLAKGDSPVRAGAFADYWINDDVNRYGPYAEAYARAYEEQVSAGKSHHEAWSYAITFAGYYQEFCGDDWEESEMEGEVERARIHTDGHLRACGKGFHKEEYAKKFASNYERTPEQPLSEIEARTDVEMKAGALKLAHRNDKGCDPGTVYLNLETQYTAADVGGWDKRDQLRVSAAVVITSRGPRIFMDDQIQELGEVLARAERIVGYNVRNFDLKVLEGYDGLSIGKARVVDLMDEVERGAGRRVRLQALASATLGKRFSHDSLEVVRFWKEGRVLDVIDGCSDRVYAVQALHEHARAHGELFYFPPESEERVRIGINKDALR